MSYEELLSIVESTLPSLSDGQVYQLIDRCKEETERRYNKFKEEVREIQYLNAFEWECEA